MKSGLWYWDLPKHKRSKDLLEKQWASSKFVKLSGDKERHWYIDLEKRPTPGEFSKGPDCTDADLELIRKRSSWTHGTMLKDKQN